MRAHQRLEPRRIDRREFGGKLDGDLAIARIEQHEVLGIDIAPIRGCGGWCVRSLRTGGDKCGDDTGESDPFHVWSFSRWTRV